MHAATKCAHRGDRIARVDHLRSSLDAGADHPIGKVAVVDGDGREVCGVTAREQAKAELGSAAPSSPSADLPAKRRFPVPVEVDRFFDPDVPIAAHQQEIVTEFGAVLCHLLGQVGEENQIGAGIAEEVMGTDLLHTCDHVVGERLSFFVGVDIGNMHGPDRVCCFRRSGLVAEQNDLAARQEAAPAGKRILQSRVVAERQGCREQGNHDARQGSYRLSLALRLSAPACQRRRCVFNQHSTSCDCRSCSLAFLSQSRRRRHRQRAAGASWRPQAPVHATAQPCPPVETHRKNSRSAACSEHRRPSRSDPENRSARP